MHNSLEIARDQLLFLFRGFIAQLPYILIGFSVLAVCWGATRLVRSMIRRALRRHDPALGEMIGNLATAGMLFLGFLLGLWIAIPTVRFTEVMSSLGVTGIIVGFALRDMLENFVAGIIILWRRPYWVGDFLRSGIHEGAVTEINFRATILPLLR